MTTPTPDLIGCWLRIQGKILNMKRLRCNFTALHQFNKLCWGNWFAFISVRSYGKDRDFDVVDVVNGFKSYSVSWVSFSSIFSMSNSTVGVFSRLYLSMNVPIVNLHLHPQIYILKRRVSAPGDSTTCLTDIREKISMEGAGNDGAVRNWYSNQVHFVIR